MSQKKWKTSEKPVELASVTFRPSLGSASTNYVPYLSAAYRNTLPPLVSETLREVRAVPFYVPFYVPCPITCRPAPPV